MAHAWKACWVHALRGSNPLSSARSDGVCPARHTPSTISGDPHELPENRSSRSLRFRNAHPAHLAAALGTGRLGRVVPFDRRAAGPARSRIRRVPLPHGRAPRHRRRRRLVGAVLGRTPAPALLADQVVHLGRGGAHDRRRVALARRPGGGRVARPRSGRPLGAGAPHHRAPPAVHDGGAQHGQPRRGLGAGAGRPGEGLPARPVRRSRGHPAHLRQRDHVRPGPDGRTGHRPRPPGTAGRAALPADGHRPRRMGSGGERCRIRVPRAAPHDRGRRSVRRVAAARRHLERPPARPARLGGARDPTARRHRATRRRVGRPRLPLRLRLPVLDVPERLLRQRRVRPAVLGRSGPRSRHRRDRRRRRGERAARRLLGLPAARPGRGGQRPRRRDPRRSAAAVWHSRRCRVRRPRSLP